MEVAQQDEHGLAGYFDPVRGRSPAPRRRRQQLAVRSSPHTQHDISQEQEQVQVSINDSIMCHEQQERSNENGKTGSGIGGINHIGSLLSAASYTTGTTVAFYTIPKSAFASSPCTTPPPAAAPHSHTADTLSAPPRLSAVAPLRSPLCKNHIDNGCNGSSNHNEQHGPTHPHEQIQDDGINHGSIHSQEHQYEVFGDNVDDGFDVLNVAAATVDTTTTVTTLATTAQRLDNNLPVNHGTEIQEEDFVWSDDYGIQSSVPSWTWNVTCLLVFLSFIGCICCYNLFLTSFIMALVGLISILLWYESA